MNRSSRAQRLGPVQNIVCMEAIHHRTKPLCDTLVLVLDSIIFKVEYFRWRPSSPIGSQSINVIAWLNVYHNSQFKTENTARHNTAAGVKSFNFPKTRGHTHTSKPFLYALSAICIFCLSSQKGSGQEMNGWVVHKHTELVLLAWETLSSYILWKTRVQVNPYLGNPGSIYE